MGLVADPVDADVHRADEPHPVLVFGEPPRNARVAGEIEHDDEQHQRDHGDQHCDPRTVDVEDRGPHREAREHEERERDESGEPLEHDRAERDRGGARSGGGAADPQHVASDRRRQHVADEQPGQIVTRQCLERDLGVEDGQDPLPAPGRQDHTEQCHQQRGSQEDRRKHVVPVGEEFVGVRRLVHEHAEQGNAHDDARPELPPRCGPGHIGGLGTHGETA